MPVGTFPNVNMHFLPTLCNHCEQPPCADACPLEAIKKSNRGIIILLEEVCDGCQACLDACPYGVIEFNDEKEIAEKCNLCIHRIKVGLEPFCVICCEGQAIHFGDLNDPGYLTSHPSNREDCNYRFFTEKLLLQRRIWGIWESEIWGKSGVANYNLGLNLGSDQDNRLIFHKEDVKWRPVWGLKPSFFRAERWF
jgi:Fe-S-cluster-containing dehydrogenase component